MSLWKVSWGAAKSYSDFSRRVTEGAVIGQQRRALERVPRSVARRGWLVDGDPDPPPGADLLDYRGVAGARDVGAAHPGDVVLGAAVDLDHGAAPVPFGLPLDAFMQHVAVIAPPGVGKTYGIIAPLAVRLLRAGASVVTLDVTGDLARHIAEFACETSTGSLRVPLRHWSTDRLRGKHRWNPLEGIRADDLTAIEGVRSSILGDKPDDPKHRVFHDRELRILGALLRVLVAERPDANLTHLARLALDRGLLAGLLQRSQHADLVYELHDFLAADTHDASLMLTDLQSKLAPFLAPEVAATVERSDFDLLDVLHEPTLLVVGAESQLRQRGEIAAALMGNRLAAELAGRYGQGYGVPVVLLLDEAPVLARRLDLATMLATLRATRTGIVLAAQNVTQFGDADARSALLDSCGTFVLLPGASEASLRLFQSRLGMREVRRRSIGYELGKVGASVNVAGDVVPLVGDRELLHPPFGLRPGVVHVRQLGARPVAVEFDRLAVGTVERGSR